MSGLIAILLCAAVSTAQPTFKTIWKTYSTGWVVHEYTYNLVQTDSARLYLADSATIYVSTDSLVSMKVSWRNNDQSEYKTVNYLSAKKQLLKTEEYKDETLLESNEWRYDEKNRKQQHYKDSKVTGASYRKQYEYISEKNGDAVILESSYYNNTIEFYTKYFYDKDRQLYKEVRLNDNNKDIIHVETYTYGENGKVKERSVFFPEFKVTKKFAESAGNVPAKCFGFKPAGIADKPNNNTRIAYMKRLIAKNQALISDPVCTEFEFTFNNTPNCSVTIASSKVNKGKTVKYRLKEKAF